MQTIAFLYAFGSPNAYLAHKVLGGIAARNGARVAYLPVLLGGVFKATNNQSPMDAFAGVTGKLDYQRTETNRFVERHAIPYRFNPHFPVMTMGVMRGAVYAQGHSWEQTYIDAVFDAMGVDGHKMDDPSVITEVLGAADLPAREIIEAAQSSDVKSGLIEATQTAVHRGTFGSPTMFVGDEMFYGKDSLVDLEWRLSATA